MGYSGKLKELEFWTPDLVVLPIVNLLIYLLDLSQIRIWSQIGKGGFPWQA